jgi:hypothetical protein
MRQHDTMHSCQQTSLQHAYHSSDRLRLSGSLCVPHSLLVISPYALQLDWYTLVKFAALLFPGLQAAQVCAGQGSSTAWTGFQGAG